MSPRKNTSQADLAKAFTTVSKVLKENQQSLNAADPYNHNHGDNMVKNFQVISKAMRETKGAAPSEQLAHASAVLARQSQSGSGRLYSQGLAQAADRVKGKQSISQEDVMALVQALMSGGAPAGQGVAAGQGAQAQGGDLLGSLLGGGSQGASQGATGGGDLLGGLLGSLLGGQAPAQTQSHSQQGHQAQSADGFGLDDLLSAGMAFMQARQQGQAPLQALVQAVMAGSQMNNTAHQAQSGELVASTLINVLTTMLAKPR